MPRLRPDAPYPECSAGQVAAIFVIVVAAAEAAVGLAIVIAIFRRHPSINIDEFNVLRW